MTHGDTGDGRLELDELGGVLDRATDLSGRPDLLRDDVLEGAEGTGWAERLEDAGVTGFVRRHRVALVCATLVAVVSTGALTAFVRTRPPTDDGRVLATISDADGDVPVGFAGDGTLQFAYRVEPGRPGDSLRINGISGPGIRASKVSEEAAAIGEPGAIDNVVVVVSCDDPAALTSGITAYSLQVSRTDSFGRTVSRSVALPSTTNGQWPATISNLCLTRTLAESVTTESVTVLADDARHQIRLVLRLHNSLADDVTLVGGLATSSVRATVDALPVKAGATASMPVTLDVVDCHAPHLEAVMDPANDSYVFGMYMSGNLLANLATGEAVSGTIIARWSDATQQAIQAGLDRMCSGMPVASTVVVSAGPASNPALRARVSATGPSDVVVLRSALEIRTDADHVVIADSLTAADLAQGAVARLTTAGGDVVGGRVRLRIDWALSCSDITPPPDIALQLTSRGRTFPGITSFEDPAVARAYLRACPERSQDELAAAGWTVSAP